jgi:hypothetical protein
VLLAHGVDDQIVLYVDSAPGRSAVGPELTSGKPALPSAFESKADQGWEGRQCRLLT